MFKLESYDKLLNIITELKEKLNLFSLSKDDTDKKIKEIEGKINPPYNDYAIKKSIDDIESKIPAPYNDSEIKKLIESIKCKITGPYDDSKIKESIENIIEKIPALFDDSKLKLDIKRVNKKIAYLSEEIEKSNKLNLSNSKQIKSNRDESMRKMDQVEQKLNRLLGAK